jgi:hypothetical protein
MINKMITFITYFKDIHAGMGLSQDLNKPREIEIDLSCIRTILLVYQYLA